MRRLALALTVAAVAMLAVLAAPLSAQADTVRSTGQSHAGCQHPVLILSAMPLELSPLVAAAKLDPAKTVRVDGRVFYVGALAGNPVVMAMSRIGVVNAAQATTDAIKAFRCSFRAIVFSGVAGSRDNIGDVTVPTRWTLDHGKTWLAQDSRMYKVASRLAGAGKVKLQRSLPTGDPACACEGPSVATPVTLPNPPQVRPGGSGYTTDPFGGYSVPCVPGGGDIAGCEPCVLQGDPAYDAQDFANRAPKDMSASFIEAVFAANSGPSDDNVVASDEETASVATVARHYHIPFLGIRAVSDGAGDPLHLPGFPSQFLAYRQLAANNAAAVTITFLQSWTYAGRPV
jgi:nucleoside phosphorylase